MEIDKIINKVENALKKEEDYKNFRVSYIMFDKEIDRMYAYANEDDEAVFVDLNTLDIDFILDWTYSIDNDIFYELERGNEIIFMTPDFHSCIWNYVDDVGIENIESKKGMQLYLDYCEKDEITKDFLFEKFGTHIPDIMKYHETIPRCVFYARVGTEEQLMEK